MKQGIEKKNLACHTNFNVTVGVGLGMTPVN